MIHFEMNKKGQQGTGVLVSSVAFCLSLSTLLALSWEARQLWSYRDSSSFGRALSGSQYP